MPVWGSFSQLELDVNASLQLHVAERLLLPLEVAAYMRVLSQLAFHLSALPSLALRFETVAIPKPSHFLGRSADRPLIAAKLHSLTLTNVRLAHFLALPQICGDLTALTSLSLTREENWCVP